jgi:hypothetical protein|tara:strand:- start:194 stop:391 length:198 start_codon:yes stop_codon:yes gene_type:complete
MFKQDRGLGDTVARFTKATGIRKAVDIISDGLNIPCGCEARQEALNNLVPYNKQFNMRRNGNKKN